MVRSSNNVSNLHFQNFKMREGLNLDKAPPFQRQEQRMCIEPICWILCGPRIHFFLKYLSNSVSSFHSQNSRFLVLKTKFWQENWNGTKFPPFQRQRMCIGGSLCWILCRLRILIYWQKYLSLFSTFNEIPFDHFGGNSDLLTRIYLSGSSSFNEILLCQVPKKKRIFWSGIPIYCLNP